MIIPMFLTAGFDPTKKMEIAEALPYGLKTAVLGMGVIFAALIILLIVLSLFKVIFYKPVGGEKKEAPVAAPAPAPVVPAPTAASSDDAELVAAITAAIACMTNKPATSFRVVSFKRTASK